MPKRTAVDNPSPAHARDAESIMQFFSAESGIATVLLVGACARGKATEDTDLDILVLRAPGATENVRVTLTERWERFTPPVSEFLRQRVSMQRSISNSAMVILYRSRGGGRPAPTTLSCKLAMPSFMVCRSWRRESTYGSSRNGGFPSPALFIARCAYPIAYDKWVREQVEEILGLPELYQQLPKLFEIQRFESQEIADKAEDLVGLFEKYTIE